MDILRFITAGNVDDGKSTLIGRLLYDTKNIKSDVLASVGGDRGDDAGLNLAHITDGLRSERAQGITIDVAYKYFTTKDRKYIITDAPGHFHYTRNLVTGASNVDVMIVLIDAQLGITEQTQRHSLVASFLNISQVVVAVNKMDLVGYDEQRFNAIKNDFLELAEKLQLKDLTIIPISALLGDNLSFPSTHMPWNNGKTLEQYLAGAAPAAVPDSATRFDVQYVAGGAESGYAGKLLSGKLKIGDTVAIYPHKHIGVVERIMHGYDEVEKATAGQNCCLFLTSAFDAVRGDLITHPDDSPMCNDHFEATLCWLDADAPLHTNKEYQLHINSFETRCAITEVVCKTDVNTYAQNNNDKQVAVNEFARVKIKTKDKVAYDLFATLPVTGRGILIDTATNYTCGAFVIEK
jgi:sulfate adenylyltransferase subunit 1